MDRRLCELRAGEDLIDERGNQFLVCGDRIVRSRQSMSAGDVMDLVEEPTVDGRSDLVEGEDGCQVGTQLNRRHYGATGNEALRGLASAGTDLDHDR